MNVFESGSTEAGIGKLARILEGPWTDWYASDQRGSNFSVIYFIPVFGPGPALDFFVPFDPPTLNMPYEFVVEPD